MSRGDSIIPRMDSRHDANRLKSPNANPEEQKAGGGGGDKNRRNRNKNKQQQQNGNKGESAAAAGGDVDKLSERVGSLNVDDAGAAAAAGDKAGQQRGNNKRGKKPEQGRFIRRSLFL